jgi:Fic family protein
VPPPPGEVSECISALEKFIHSDDPVPALVKAALAHVQFETIHPFLDGNGRVGRLLIVLMLQEERVLRAPLLYLSLYFKQHRDEYYRLLDSVRRDGDWEAWLDFFLEGVTQTAGAAVETAQRLLKIFSEDEELVAFAGRGAGALRTYRALRERPVATIQDLVKRSGVSFPTASKAIVALEKAGVVREMTGGRRDRVFVYGRYLDVLNEGTEPL